MQPLLELSPRDHRLGNGVRTLVEYGDFECEDCGAAFPILERVQRLMSDELSLVFRHFPLESHAHAMLAAEAAEAAAAQDRFWEMHHLLYDRQTELERVDLVRYARELGLDVARFEREIDAHVHLARIAEDVASGKALGVRGTPALFVNGALHREQVTVPLLMEALRSTDPHA